MLPKKNRNNRREVSRIFTAGRPLHGSVFSLKFIISGKRSPKISFIAPKNLAKSSTQRNNLRRQGYRAIKNFIPELPLGFQGVFVFKKLNEEIDNDLKKIISKIN